MVQSLSFLMALACSVATAAALRVPVWSVHEIAVRAAPTATIIATFSGAGGTTQKVRAFQDGGNAQRIRWTPVKQGRWTFIVRGPNVLRRGSLIATEAKTGAHGFLRSDPEHPYSFVFDNGGHPFFWGNTYYELPAKGDTWKRAVERSRFHGMNRSGCM